MALIFGSSLRAEAIDGGVTLIQNACLTPANRSAEAGRLRRCRMPFTALTNPREVPSSHHGPHGSKAHAFSKRPEPTTFASFIAPLGTASVLFVVLTLGPVGCAGERQDVLSAHDAHKGAVRVFNVGMAQAWEAARAALRWNHADTIEEHRAEGYMLATAGVSAWSWGASMGVWLEPANAQGTQVRAIVSRKLATNVFGQSEDVLLDDIAKAVALEKQGQPLPDTDPD
jgi:hypothetical protein